MNDDQEQVESTVEPEVPSMSMQDRLEAEIEKHNQLLNHERDLKQQLEQTAAARQTQLGRVTLLQELANSQ